MNSRSTKAEACVIRRQDRPLTVVEVSRPGLQEFYVTCAPQDSLPTGDAAAQAAEVYRRLGGWLREQGAGGVQERIFGSLRDREAILAERQALVEGEDLEPWPIAFVEGKPCDHEGLAGVHLYAVAGPRCSPIHDKGRLCGIVFEHRDARHVYLSALPALGSTATRREEARALFERADEVLRGVGCSYADVVRTWLYVADILDWYDEFNAGRSAAYSELCPPDRAGSRWLPASTGIEARLPDSAHCLMDLFALGGPGRQAVSVEALRNPRQCEAHSYGSAFSRGATVAFEGAETVYVSGTAAIDEAGRSVCHGDLPGQVIRTLENIASLLSTRQMTLDDLVSSTIFVKHGQDAELVRRLIADRGGPLVDSVYVLADVCRPELLFEADAIAVRAPG